MSEYEFLNESEDYMDVLIGAGFESPLPISLFPKILMVISENVVKVDKKMFFEGLSKVELNQTNVRFQFRFSRRKVEIDSLNPEERDDLPRNRVNFVIYIIALVDSIHRLNDVPFPSDFRNILNYPPF